MVQNTEKKSKEKPFSIVVTNWLDLGPLLTIVYKIPLGDNSLKGTKALSL